VRVFHLCFTLQSRLCTRVIGALQQFSLLDSSLDQLIEGSDVGGFFDSPPRLVMICFCLETRRVSLIVGVVFVQGEHYFGPPQICDGPIALSLLDSWFALQLCLHVGVLEGGDLLLEFVIVMLQCLLLALWSDMLLLHLLLHFGKHLKDLASYSNVGHTLTATPCDKEPISSAVCCRSVGDAFWRGTIEGDNLLSWGHRYYGRDLLRKVLG